MLHALIFHYQFQIEPELDFRFFHLLSTMIDLLYLLHYQHLEFEIDEIHLFPMDKVFWFQSIVYFGD
nr:hypothetical protein [Elizabethkingia sp. ASV34]